jgi:16S rRNA (guanine966-N2)-methyltransferase
MAYVTEDTLIVVEATLDRDFSFAQELGYVITREKNYKTNKHVFLKKQEA